MGEGLLEARGGARMEDVGEENFKILTSRSFFQPSVHFNSRFIMHDCVHDLATFVLGDFGFRVEDNNLHKLPSKTRHLSIMMDTIDDSEQDVPEQLNGISKAKCLRTFLLGHYFDFLVLSVPFLNRLLMEEGCLRVLLLNRFWIAKLPDSIGNLKHIRYLDLSHTSIKEIPDTICTLYNLETLLLKSCEDLTRLPIDIARLIKLRHLNLTVCPMVELPLQIFDMKDLQTLKPSFILQKEHDDSSIKNLGAFQQLHGQLGIQGLENVVDGKNVFEAKLRDKMFITALHLCWGNFWDDDSMIERDPMKEREILDQLQPHTNLKELEIWDYSGRGFSDWMGDQSFSNIVEVKVYGCNNCRSLWPLDQLPSLKALSIEESFERVETINWEFFSEGSSMTKPFRSLESLKLEVMTELKEWLFREGEVVFPTLKELWLSCCPHLEVRLLPDCFPSLTKLEVLSCRQLKLLPATHQGLIFPSLQELAIRYCREQELILEGGLPSSLEIIDIYGCGNLKALDNNGFRLLTSLRQLNIEFCEQLQCLPDLPSYPFELEIRRCPFLNSRCQENGEDWHKIKHTQLYIS
ncbi:hypothetical protein UlMin_023767 [Ulmus minor]